MMMMMMMMLIQVSFDIRACFYLNIMFTKSSNFMWFDFEISCYMFLQGLIIDISLFDRCVFACVRA